MLKGTAHKGKNSLPLEANSFLLGKFAFEKERN